jgi:hypothetical protein
MKKKIEKVNPSLQIDESMNLHSKGWILQRIGWALLLILLVCASLGLFGSGILSYNELSHEGHKISFERFGRFEAQQEIRIQTFGLSGQSTISFPQQYLENFELETVVPQPVTQKVLEGDVIFSFTAIGPMTATFYVKPQKTGTQNTTVKVNNNRFHLRQLIYP